MKAYVLYRSNSEHGRAVEEFKREFERRQSNRHLELVDMDTKEGADLAQLYGVMQYPAIIAVRDDGQLLQLWQGEPLPLMNEVAAYA